MGRIFELKMYLQLNGVARNGLRFYKMHRIH